MDTIQVGTLALRAFAIVGLTSAFFPSLTRSRGALGVTFVIAVIAVAIVWGN